MGEEPTGLHRPFTAMRPQLQVTDIQIKSRWLAAVISKFLAFNAADFEEENPFPGTINEKNVQLSTSQSAKLKKQKTKKAL